MSQPASTKHLLTRPTGDRAPYRAPRFTRWGSLPTLTRGSTGVTSDGNMTGTSETFEFVSTGEWRFGEDR